MNKKITIVCTIILLTIAFFLFQKYVPYNMEVRDKIMPPENTNISIEGIWEIKKFSIFNTSSNKETMSNFEASKMIGKKAAFSSKYGFFIDEISLSPKYKTKNVNTKDYFSYIYKLNIDNIGIKNKKAEVISVISDGKLFYEFIKIDDNNMILQRQGIFFYLEKIGEDTEKFFKENNLKERKTKGDIEKLKEDKLLRSGVLIGLRDDDPNNSNSIENKLSSYRTIWIPSKNRKLLDILQVESLFLPRMDGFWRIGVNRYTLKGKDFKDEILAYNKHEEENKKSFIDDKNEINIYKKIVFAGNDYLCMEYKKIQDENSKDFYRVLPIHATKNRRGIKISDIFGEEGKKAIKNSAEAFLASQDQSSMKDIEREPNEENFSLARSNGYWIVKGRLNDKNIIGHEYKDYNININPSNKMISFNTFSISWNEVKSRIPDAVDAYTSPNKDIALIISNDNIKVYEMNGNELSSKALYKIPIKKSESIIMAEWATGDYLEKWTKEINSESNVTVVK